MSDLLANVQSGVLDAQGPIAAAERLILLNATAIMLAVIVPVMIATVVIAWWFRAGNAHAKRRPDWTYSGVLEVVVWGIPLLVILFLGGIAWISSHDLAPRKPIASEARPLRVQVVALDWKWLFILPEQNVASVNRLVVPAGTPLAFDITSATVMNSFFVPQLGSQIYAMAGMSTKLHLLADHPGEFGGLSAMFSGAGFSSMRFTVSALAQPAFDDWVKQTKAGDSPLDASRYADLAKPGTPKEQFVFSSVPDGLFDRIVMGNGQPEAAPKQATAAVPDLPLWLTREGGFLKTGFSRHRAVIERGNDLCSAN